MAKGKRWRWALVLVLFVAGFLWWERKAVRHGLRWVEKRYFAYIGDSGPLVVVKRGAWKQWHPGVWMRSIVYKRKRHWSRIHLYITRVDPKQVRLHVWRGKPRHVRWIMQHTEALAAINGGPFLPSKKPWGLFKHQGRLLQKHLFQRNNDGVFYVEKGNVGIASARNWKHEGRSYAFQSAPLLVAEGKRRALPRASRWRVDRRSALCVDPHGHLLMMTTDGFFNGLSYYEMGLLLAASYKRGGFQCQWALNLDGGASSQWAFRQNDETTVVSGLEKTPLYLLVLPWSRPNQPDERLSKP